MSRNMVLLIESKITHNFELDLVRQGAAGSGTVEKLGGVKWVDF